MFAKFIEIKRTSLSILIRLTEHTIACGCHPRGSNQVDTGKMCLNQGLKSISEAGFMHTAVAFCQSQCLRLPSPPPDQAGWLM